MPDHQGTDRGGRQQPLEREAKANAEQNELVTRLATEAARFNGVQADPVTARTCPLAACWNPTPSPARNGATSSHHDTSARN